MERKSLKIVILDLKKNNYEQETLKKRAIPKSKDLEKGNSGKGESEKG